MDDEHEKRLKLERELDQNLAEVREEYLSFIDAEKEQFKAWLSKIVDIDEPNDVLSDVKLRIQFLIHDGDGLKTVLASVRSLKRAIPFWDRGEPYLPSPADKVWK